MVQEHKNDISELMTLGHLIERQATGPTRQEVAKNLASVEERWNVLLTQSTARQTSSQVIYLCQRLVCLCQVAVGGIM